MLIYEGPRIFPAPPPPQTPPLTLHDTKTFGSPSSCFYDMQKQVTPLEQ